MSLQALEKKFKLIAGQASLDFANTVGGRTHARNRKMGRDYQAAIRAEKLEHYDDLLAWSLKSGLLSEIEVKTLRRKAEVNPKAAALVLGRAIKLREALYRLFKCAIETWRPDVADLNSLNEELRVAQKHQRLVHDQQGFRLGWDNGEPALDKMLWLLAESAAEILTSAELARVKQCGGDDCGWVFLDTSRSRNRTWCDMRDCGNLAKVHRFRRKAS